MGKLVQADEATHKELLADLKIIKSTVQIEPYIRESRNRGKLFSILGVRVTCGNDKPQDRTLTYHRGEREGSEWEKSKRIWRQVYKYVKDYIGAMSMSGGLQLADEARYVGYKEEKLEQIFKTSADLARYYKALGMTHEAAVPFDSEFQMWVAQYALDAQQRLIGRTKVNIGSDARLRFSPAEMKELLEVFESEKVLWRRARNVFWTHENNPNWREMVKAEFYEVDNHYSVDDDLLDAIAQRTGKGEFQYRPVQVAVVSAARQASFDNKEDWYSPPSMAQHRMIEKAVNEWRKRFDEAKQLNLRW